MQFRYYIFSGGEWVECSYYSYSRWDGKKYKSATDVLHYLNNGEIQVEEQKPELKTFYASGMSFVNGHWASCGWSIEATSFAEAARIAEEDKNYRIHSLSDSVIF